MGEQDWLVRSLHSARLNGWGLKGSRSECHKGKHLGETILRLQGGLAAFGCRTSQPVLQVCWFPTLPGLQILFPAIHQ